MGAELKNQGEDRRKSPRVQVATRIEVAGREAFYFTRDMSTSGLFINCDSVMIPIGTMLQIGVALPGVRQVLPVQGRVVRHAKTEVTGEAAGVGVEFVNVPDEITMLLEQTIERLADASSSS